MINCNNSIRPTQAYGSASPVFHDAATCLYRQPLPSFKTIRREYHKTLISLQAFNQSSSPCYFDMGRTLLQQKNSWCARKSIYS